MNGESYIGLAKIFGQRNSQEANNYKWLHQSPFLGINYYRLKQIDFNGDLAFSDIVSVQNDALPFLSYSAFPQPASDRVNLIINVLDEENLIHLTIYNTKGEIIDSISVDPMNKEIQLDASSLSDGMYLVKLNQADQFYHGKLIIQK